MEDAPVRIGAPVAVDDPGQEQPGNHEEVRHPERLREVDRPMHEALLAELGLDAERGVHHHDEHDADALGAVDPVDARRVRRHAPGARHGRRVHGRAAHGATVTHDLDHSGILAGESFPFVSRMPKTGSYWARTSAQ